MHAYVCKLSFSFVVLAHFNACRSKKRGAGVKGLKGVKAEAVQCLPEPTGSILTVSNGDEQNQYDGADSNVVFNDFCYSAR